MICYYCIQRKEADKIVSLLSFNGTDKTLIRFGCLVNHKYHVGPVRFRFFIS